MVIIEIIGGENNGHMNQTADVFPFIPEGWAVCPEDMQNEECFPFFSDIQLDEFGNITYWTNAEVPEPVDPPEQENQYVTWDDLANAYRKGVDSI